VTVFTDVLGCFKELKIGILQPKFFIQLSFGVEKIVCLILDVHDSSCHHIVVSAVIQLFLRSFLNVKVSFFVGDKYARASVPKFVIDHLFAIGSHGLTILTNDRVVFFINQHY